MARKKGSDVAPGQIRQPRLVCGRLGDRIWALLPFLHRSVKPWEQPPISAALSSRHQPSSSQNIPSTKLSQLRLPKQRLQGVACRPFH